MHLLQKILKWKEARCCEQQEEKLDREQSEFQENA